MKLKQSHNILKNRFRSASCYIQRRSCLCCQHADRDGPNEASQTLGLSCPSQVKKRWHSVIRAESISAIPCSLQCTFFFYLDGDAISAIPCSLRCTFFFYLDDMSLLCFFKGRTKQPICVISKKTSQVFCPAPYTQSVRNILSSTTHSNMIKDPDSFSGYLQ